MQKTSRKKRVSWTATNLTKAAHHLAVHTDSNSHLSPTLRLERSATLSIANRTRGTHFIFGPVAAVTALRLAQIETQTQIALQQLAVLASIIVGNQCRNGDLPAALPPHLALLSLLNRQLVSAGGLSNNTNRKNSTFTRPGLSAAMYYQHPQQQGSQPFPNAPRPSQHQPSPNQLSNHPNMQAMSFQFPRPTQLPDELESALAIRGVRDVDHRQIDHLNQPNQGSGSVIGQQGGCGPNPISLTADSQPGHQQGVDWSSYQPPTKLFANPPSNPNPQGTQQPPQTRQSHGVGVGGESHGLYTPESAGSILASFGLSNEDLEVLSHYPDDQLTPDTLPFILRDIQINKSGKQKTAASASSSSFSRSIHDVQVPSQSPEVPSLLTVTQTAGKVIDYGHASRGNDESATTRERVPGTFKREPLLSERTVKMYPASSSIVPKVDKTESRDVHLEHKEPNKHGDQDYRRASSKKRRRSRSPETKFPSSPKSRNLDRDYRQDGSKQRPSSESRSKVSSRQPLSSSSGSRPHGISRKLPTPTMISDFAAVPPKVYPHTCSLCNIQCDEEKDWVDHVNTVNHTSACRDLRNKYPHWKPDLPSRSGRYGSRALWDPKDGSPFHSMSQSLSRTPSPPQGKYRMDTHPLRQHGRSYSPHRHQRPQTYTERSHRFDRHHSRSHSPPYKQRTPSSSRDSWPERRSRELSGGLPRGVKRPHDDLRKGSPSQPSTKATKGTLKPGSKTTKMSLKPPPAKKKKKKTVFQDVSAAHRLVYLTGIPVDASEQEVTDLVRSFGKINNVILMSCSEEESEKSQGQKASVCMMTAEDAQALASSKTLSIRDQEITATVSTILDNEQSSDTNSITAPEQGKSEAGNNSAADGANQKTTDQDCKVLITGLPENSCSESDIIQLVQPYTTPCDIILAAHLGKALVSLPDLEVAQELVKVHSSKPANVNDSEVKIALLKQHVGLDTPVALYNIFVGPADLLENVAPVSWNTLLVIRNVPNTPSGPSEVLKLVRRFGTVIKTLVLNSMVICEMATSAMAFSVFKRFQMFPCIIHNNPLFFSRKPDRKVSVQSKINAASGDSPEVIPEKGGDGQPAAADEDGTAGEENSEPPLEEKEEDGDEKDKSRCGDECLGENESSMKKEENANSDDLATQSTEADAGLVTEMTEAPAVEAETAEVNKTASDADMSSVGGETKASDDNETSASPETAMPELPKMTQAMVNALLVECRTRTASHPNNTATPSSGEQKEAREEMEQGEKAAEKTKETAKNSVEEEGMKKQERERKEAEARKEKETREKERRERERRALERERDKREKERADRAKRERDRREEERRDWERRERERRDRKRSYDEGHSGSRSYHRSKGYRQSSWRDETAKEEEEEELDDFPFNMSDFVTVDEVGDVTDLPQSPSPNVPVETLEDEDAAPTSVQQDTPEDVEVTEPQANSEEQLSESERTTMSAAETSDVLAQHELTLSLDLSAAASVPPASQINSSSSGTPNPNPTLTCQSEAPQPDIKPEPDTSLTTTLDSTSDVEPLSIPVPAAASDSSSTSPAEGVTTADSRDENKSKTFTQANNKEMLDVSIKQEENEQMQEKESKEAADANEEAGKLDEAQDQNAKEKSLETKLPMDTATKTERQLLPYDPNKPVGMEYLVPKTGFFCKVCGRFFSGAKVAQISHCKTLKHYENLQKCLQTTEASVSAIKMDSN